METRRQQQQALIANLPCARRPSPSHHGLVQTNADWCTLWSTAANMEVAMPVHDPVQRHKLITSPLPPSGSIAESADSKTRHSSKKRKTSAEDNKKPHPTTAAVQGPFDPIDEATYDHLRRQAIQQGVPTRDQPLNPQQRDAARSLVEYAIFYHMPIKAQQQLKISWTWQRKRG